MTAADETFETDRNFIAVFHSEAACQDYIIKRTSVKPACLKTCKKAENNNDSPCMSCNKRRVQILKAVFPKMKMPLMKVFDSAWRLVNEPFGISAKRLGKRICIEASAYNLAQKLRMAAAQANSYDKLSGYVNFGSITVQDNSDKKKLLMAVEKQKGSSDDLIGKICASIIDIDEPGQYLEFLDRRIAKGSTIKTDADIPKFSKEYKWVNGDPTLLHGALRHLQKRIDVAYDRSITFKHPQSYIDEFVFFSNRRHMPRCKCFEMLVRMLINIGRKPYEA